MTTIDYQPNPDGKSEVEWIPVFELFARRVANTQFEPLEPTAVATTRLGDLETLPSPSPRTRLEIERTPGLEEIRWIDTTNGTYRSAVGDTARGIIADWDNRERELFADADPDPEEFQGAHGKPGVMQRDGAFYRCIVEYDNEGSRDMPLRRKAGEIKDASEFWRMSEDPRSWIFIGDNTAFCASAKSGDYWVTTDKLVVNEIKNGSGPSECSLPEVKVA